MIHYLSDSPATSSTAPVSGGTGILYCYGRGDAARELAIRLCGTAYVDQLGFVWVHAEAPRPRFRWLRRELNKAVDIVTRML